MGWPGTLCSTGFPLKPQDCCFVHSQLETNWGHLWRIYRNNSLSSWWFQPLVGGKLYRWLDWRIIIESSWWLGHSVEKYLRQIGWFPQGSGWKFQKSLEKNHHSCFCMIHQSRFLILAGNFWYLAAYMKDIFTNQSWGRFGRSENSQQVRGTSRHRNDQCEALSGQELESGNSMFLGSAATCYECFDLKDKEIYIYKYLFVYVITGR